MEIDECDADYFSNRDFIFATILANLSTSSFYEKAKLKIKKEASCKLQHICD